MQTLRCRQKEIYKQFYTNYTTDDIIIDGLRRIILHKETFSSYIMIVTIGTTRR